MVFEWCQTPLVAILPNAHFLLVGIIIQASDRPSTCTSQMLAQAFSETTSRLSDMMFLVYATITAPRWCGRGEVRTQLRRGQFRSPKACSSQRRQTKIAQRPSTCSELFDWTVRGRTCRTSDGVNSWSYEKALAVQRELPPVSLDQGGRPVVSAKWKSAGRPSDPVDWRVLVHASPASPRRSVGPWMHGLCPRQWVLQTRLEDYQARSQT